MALAGMMRMVTLTPVAALISSLSLAERVSKSADRTVTALRSVRWASRAMLQIWEEATGPSSGPTWTQVWPLRP